MDKFFYLYDNSPIELKQIINSLIGLKQNKLYHSEKDVYEHTLLVVNRLHNKYNDNDLDLAGYFHDLGKIDTTDSLLKSIGHELKSLEYIEKFKNFIIQMNGNYDLIYEIVSEHMRVKYFDNFLLTKKLNFLKLNYEYILKFDTADYGGYGDNCKEIKDVTKFLIKLKEVEDKDKLEKLVKEKFNGKIIMDIYPELTGKLLSEKIKAFKIHIYKKHNIFFNIYVSTCDNIMSEFKLFMYE